MGSAFFVAVLAAAATLAIFIGAARLLSARAERLSRRLGQAAPRTPTGEPAGEGAATVSPLAAVVEGILDAVSASPLGRRVEANLTSAGIPISAAEFIFGTITLAAFVFLVGIVLFDDLKIALALLLGAAYVPWWYARRRRAQRLQEFEAGLPLALNMLVNQLRAGASIPQAIETLARDLQSPLKEEFSRVAREVDLGSPLEEALTRLSQRIPTRDLDLLVAAINIQRDVGGNLIRMLEIMGATMRERVRLRGEVRALAAGQILSGYLVCSVPILIALFFYIVDRSYILQMFEPGWPLCMPALGTVLLVVGFIVMRNLMSVKV